MYGVILALALAGCGRNHDLDVANYHADRVIVSLETHGLLDDLSAGEQLALRDEIANEFLEARAWNMKSAN